MAKSSAELSAFSHFSRETSASPTSASPERGTSEFEEELPAKKKKSGEAAEKVAQIEEARTSSLGGPGTSSEGPNDAEFGIPDPMLELYLQDTLQAAQDSVLADWLIDPDVDLPSILTVPGEEEAHFASGQMEAQALPSLEGSSLMSLQAVTIVPGQAHPDEVSQASGSVVSSTTGHPPEGAALPLPETAPFVTDKPSAGAGPTAATIPWVTKAPSVSGIVAQESSSASRAGPSQDSPPVDQHPFSKIPVSWPRDASLPEFDFEGRFSASPDAPLSTLLEEARRILARQDLSLGDVRTLQRLGGHLVSYAGRFFKRLVGLTSDAGLVPRLGNRVLLAHYLLLVCEVVGPSMRREQWWGPHMAHILTPPPGWQPLSESGVFLQRKGRGVLVKMLIDATAILRRGERLPARLIVPIMQQLICSPDTQKCFKGKGWRGFRRANRQFLGISPADSTSSDSDEDE
ncbi:hypothetical protein ACSSS7_003134 [Eimeria intestinalis]